MKNIVFLTGAGISADSGLSTFRDSDGLWNNHRVDDVATYEGFVRNRKMVYDFYNDLRHQETALKPNPAHYALAKLQREYKNGKVTIITQNVDDYHTVAGAVDVIHMHGHLHQVRCENCMHVYRCDDDYDEKTVCPKCGKAGHIRPNIVWFGEMPLYMARIEEELEQADIFVAIGTSGVVYPAAGFISRVRSIGRAETVEINLEPSEVHRLFDRSIKGRAKDTVPAYVDELLAEQK